MQRQCLRRRCGCRLVPLRWRVNWRRRRGRRLRHTSRCARSDEQLELGFPAQSPCQVANACVAVTQPFGIAVVAFVECQGAWRDQAEHVEHGVGLADTLTVDEQPRHVFTDASHEGGERLHFERGSRDDEEVALRKVLLRQAEESLGQLRPQETTK